MSANNGAKNLCALIMVLAISIALGFGGFWLLRTYANASRWRRTSAQIVSLNIKVTPSRYGSRRFTRTKFRSSSSTQEKCNVTYKYSVGKKTYEGNRATVHEKYGPVDLCTTLRGKNTTVCYYDPKHPENSALSIKFPMTLITGLIIGSWIALLVFSGMVPKIFAIVPVVYGIASASVLLKIARKRLPIVDAGLIGGIALITFAICSPVISYCCSKIPIKRKVDPGIGY